MRSVCACSSIASSAMRTALFIVDIQAADVTSLSGIARASQARGIKAPSAKGRPGHHPLELLLLAPADDLRKRHRQHQRRTIEDVLHECADAHEDQPGNSRNQEIDREQSAPGIE